MAERIAMSAANDFSGLRYCGCTARPELGSELAGRLAHEADALRAYERLRQDLVTLIDEERAA